jgi:hypothetical protein
MSAGLSIKLPLDKSFSLNKTIRELALQNLKMVLLTSPGERVAIPDFGVGIRRFIFEQLTPATLARIESRIRSQVSEYLPAIRINSVNIDSPLNNSDLIRQGYGENFINIMINYTIIPIGKNERVTLDLTDNSVIVR